MILKVGNLTLSDWHKSDFYWDRFIIIDNSPILENYVLENYTLVASVYGNPSRSIYYCGFSNDLLFINSYYNTEITYSSFEEAAEMADKLVIKYWNLKAFL